MRASVFAAFHGFSGDLEGADIPFMYLDSADPVGFVTIATGCLLDPVSMAISLPFVHPGGKAASKAEIVACWQLVKSRQDLRKHGGMIYGGLAGNTLRLPLDAIRSLIDRKLLWFEGDLRKVFPAWDDWNACAQMFGISWAWAVGSRARYPKMIALLNAGDFDGAADECTINPQRGTIVTRNARNRMLLRNAQRVRDLGLDPDYLNWKSLLELPNAATEPTRYPGPPDSAA